MSTTTTARPRTTGFHHFSVSVSDIEASAAWYQRVLGLERVPPTFPHYGSKKSGYAVLLTDAATGLGIGLRHHGLNDGRRCDETRAGLDHFAMGVAERANLDSWAAYLDSISVPHSGITDADDPFPYSVLVFRDPDDIQLAFIHVPS